MMYDYRGRGRGVKMTTQNQTLEGKNQTLEGEGVKNGQKHRTSFMNVPLSSNFAKLKAADSAGYYIPTVYTTLKEKFNMILILLYLLFSVLL